MEELNENNFLLYSSKHYYNPTCMTTDEFIDDLKRFKYVQKLLNRFVENNNLRERLILNHIIIIYNVFGIEAGTKLLFYKIEEYYWPVLLPFLLYLNYVKYDDYVGIPLNKTVIDKLRKL